MVQGKIFSAHTLPCIREEPGLSRLTSGPHYSIFSLGTQVGARNYCIDGVDMRIEGMVISTNIPLEAGGGSIAARELFVGLSVEPRVILRVNITGPGFNIIFWYFAK